MVLANVWIVKNNADKNGIIIIINNQSICRWVDLLVESLLVKVTTVLLTKL